MGVVHPGEVAGVRDRWIAAAMAVAVAAALMLPGVQSRADETDDAVRLVPQSPRPTGTCIPFGRNTGIGFSGFMYRNVPAFSLRAGDTFAFDMRVPNDVDIRRNVYFAATNVNPQPTGGSQGVQALGWTKVASDSQVPLNPRGNDVVGDYELVYTAEADFDFPGGGFAVGVVLDSYRDPFCVGMQVYTRQADPSGHFHGRFMNHSDLTLGVLDSGAWSTDFVGGIVIYPSPLVDDVPPVTVELEVMPGNPVSPVNVRRGGPITVAVLSATDFDATAIEPDSVTFGATGVEVPALDCDGVRDVNRDGLPDLLCRFEVAHAGFASDTTSVELHGQAGEVRVHGTAAVRVVGK